ncbi:cupin domain-containing protein [Taklimakanibacter lacteus]|uniref:cupin domain-containing protein n=1 Tax=Taklimakanibacter lacteus TaxID=2268456 RepID=UPI000E66740F
MTEARVFKREEMTFRPAVTATGTTSIARVVNGAVSRHMGGGIEYLENVTIDWTVTYDEILFVFEGSLTVVLDDQEVRDCHAGDIVWLPEGTHLKYIAHGRAGYFYALHPVDWAARQGVREP